MASPGRLTALPVGVRRALQIALMSGLGLAALQSATLERLSFDNLVARSSAIVRGTVKGASVSLSGPIVYTHYTIQVSERFKGPAGATVDVVVPGGMVNNMRQTFAGTPTFHPGDEYVFFLWTSKSGLNQVLGLTQGLFSLASDASGDALATRSASRELMLDSVSGHAVKDDTLVMRLSELRSRIAKSLAVAQ